MTRGSRCRLSPTSIRAARRSRGSSTTALRRGAPLRLVPTRANGQPALGCHAPDPHTVIAHAWGLLVLTLAGDSISAITWFSERSLFSRFGMSRNLPD